MGGICSRSDHPGKARTGVGYGSRVMQDGTARAASPRGASPLTWFGIGGYWRAATAPMSMDMRSHIGRRGHDADHSDDDNDSKPEDNFDQRAANEPVNRPGAPEPGCRDRKSGRHRPQTISKIGPFLKFNLVGKADCVLRSRRWVLRWSVRIERLTFDFATSSAYSTSEVLFREITRRLMMRSHRLSKWCLLLPQNLQTV